MNNAKIVESNLESETEIDRGPWLVSRQQELAKHIDAIESIAHSSHWKYLEQNLFSGVLQDIDKKLRKEKGGDIEIGRLQGQAVWAMKYMDFKSLAEIYRKELTGITAQLK